MRPGFLMLSANTPWVFALGNALAAHRPATAMRLYDLLTWRATKPRWPGDANPLLRKVLRVLPPGYAGRFEVGFRPLMRLLVNRERLRLRRAGGDEPFVIVPYPYLAPWIEQVPDDRLIYYSLDEYAYYDPPRTGQIHALEDRLVARARLTLCLSAYQAAVLRARHPARAADIRHFPLGVEAAFINPAPYAAPQPNAIGYVGNLTDRVDWPFVAAVAKLAPTLTFDFVGSLTWLLEGVGDQAAAPDWKRARDAAFALPNVRHLGSAAQADVASYYWRSSVNWMPYDITHGFNLASCPTKIMDALASGRPFASTSVPECQLYPELIHIADDPAGMAALLTQLAAAPLPSPAVLIDFAQNQRWPTRALELLAMLVR